MSAINLFGLTQKYLSFLDKVDTVMEETEGVMTDELIKEEEDLIKEIAEKDDAAITVIDSLEHRIEQLENYRDMISESIRMHRNSQSRIKEGLKRFMQVTGINKMQGTFGSISLIQTQKLPENLTTENVPEEYIVEVVPEPYKRIDKVALKKAIKEGKVPTLQLNTEESARIYRKRTGKK